MVSHPPASARSPHLIIHFNGDFHGISMNLTIRLDPLLRCPPSFHLRRPGSTGRDSTVI